MPEVDGFVSWMAIMPKERLGVVILSNHKGTGINYALRFWIFDRLLGRPDFDWSSSVRKDYTRVGNGFFARLRPSLTPNVRRKSPRLSLLQITRALIEVDSTGRFR